MASSPGGGPSSSERFELLGELGAGGMGVVYRVLDHQRRSEVALKVLKGRSGLDLYRFKREFRVLADLRHPNLVELHELFNVLDEWMFTMELVVGVPFLHWVRPAGVAGLVDEARLRDALGQIADALAAVHAIGKIHRDVKPSNILVEPDGRAVLLDFGLVTSVEELAATPTHQDLAIGTPMYMSPEQASDQPLTGASDLYSLGVMLYEALTATRPHDGPRAQMLQRRQMMDPIPPSWIAPVPADLEALCMRLLARVPEQRPDAAAVLAMLGRTATPAASRPPRVAQDRTEELAALHAAFAASRDHTVLVLVSGPPGAGKSALLEAFQAELAFVDALVLTGRAAQHESIAYRAGDQIIDQLSTWLMALPRADLARLLPENVAALTREFPVLERIPEARRPLLPGARLHDAAELRRQATAALLELATRITAERPIVILVDDAQWATEAGSRLATMLDIPSAPRVLFVLAHDRDASGTLGLAIFDGWRGDRRRIDLS